MGLSGIYTPVRASGKSAEVWCLEWTYTDGSGAVLLDAEQSDLDQRIATPVADGGTGLTSIVFPKCNRVRVLHVSCEPATEATASNFRHFFVTTVSAAAGTLSISILAANGGAVNSDPESGSRGRLVLLLDRT